MAQTYRLWHPWLTGYHTPLPRKLHAETSDFMSKAAEDALTLVQCLEQPTFSPGHVGLWGHKALRAGR